MSKKETSRHIREPLATTDTLNDSFSTVVIDTVGPLPPLELCHTFAYNITPHIDTKYSPFELEFGKLPELSGFFALSLFIESLFIINKYSNFKLKIDLCSRSLQSSFKGKFRPVSQKYNYDCMT